MEILRTIVELREYVSSIKNSQKTIGFVPTMGFLHEGHASLIERSKKENDITISEHFWKSSISTNNTIYWKSENEVYILFSLSNNTQILNIVIN